MNRSSTQNIKVGIIILLGLLIIYGIADYYFGKSVSWQESYTQESKTPYGAYLLHEQLKDVFQVDSIQTIRETAFDHLVYEFYENSNYIFINDKVPLELEDVEELTEHIERGNHVFMAARTFSVPLQDQLGFSIESNLYEKDSVEVSFTAQRLKGINFRYPAKKTSTYFDSIEGENVEILSEIEHEYPNMIQLKLGNGSIILCSTPRMFSNYYMIHPENHRYLSYALSYLPENQDLFWDEYYKVSNLRFKDSRKEGSNSAGMWSYIFKQPALKWAFWVLLGALLLYAVFESKRTQRIIPIIEPLPNTTVEFTSTVGRLYYQSKDHAGIARKKIKVWLEHIRTHYFLKTQIFDKNFIETLSGKSGIERDEISALCFMITRVRNTTELSENELIELSLHIDNFYKNAAR